MTKLSNDELESIKGSGISWSIIGLAISGIISFIIGVVDGFKRPLKCNR